MNTAELIGFSIAALVAAWVVSDLLKRGKRLDYALLWGMGVLLALIIFLPLYFVQRSTEKNAKPAAKPNLCKYCGLYYEDAAAGYCPHCGKQLKSSLEIYSPVQ